jgi:hypothetical protein
MGASQFKASQGKVVCKTPSPKEPEQNELEVYIAQGIEHLLCKYKTLSSSLSPTKKKKEEEERKKRKRKDRPRYQCVWHLAHSRT